MFSFMGIVFVIAQMAFILHAYEIARGQDQAYQIYEKFSHYPIIHVYYNRHFGNSPQFTRFLEVVDGVEQKTKGYTKIILTNCQEILKNSRVYPCEEMKRTKQNRNMVGYAPSGSFTTFGKLLVQSPPITKNLNHPSDVYTQQQIIDFFDSLTPQFYKKIESNEQYQSFLKPYYSPKLFFIYDDQNPDRMPLSVKKLSIKYYLRFDFGYVEDITTEVLSQLGVKKSIGLVLLKYNFQDQKFQMHQYTGKFFGQGVQEQLEEFVSRFALKQPRGDLIYHQISKDINSQIQEIKTPGQLRAVKSKVKGWTIIETSSSQSSAILPKLKEKYGLYFQYVHYLDPSASKTILEMYSPREDSSFSIEDQPAFVTLQANDFLSNASILVEKDYVVLAVRQKYGYLCSLVQQILFHGTAQCLIARQSDYPTISQKINQQFEIGFVGWTKIKDDQQKLEGRAIEKQDYYQIYQILEYASRQKSAEILNKFVQNPINKLSTAESIIKLCKFPTRKCVILVHDFEKKQKIRREFLKQIAVSFAQQYRFFEIDINCNRDLIAEIQKINPKIDGKREVLIVYHPGYKSFSFIASKLSKITMQKFLRVNIQNNQQIFKQSHQLKDYDYKLKVCLPGNEVISNEL